MPLAARAAPAWVAAALVRPLARVAVRARPGRSTAPAGAPREAQDRGRRPWAQETFHVLMVDATRRDHRAARASRSRSAPVRDPHDRGTQRTLVATGLRFRC